MKVIKYVGIASLLLSLLVGCGSSADSAAGFIESGKELVAEGKVEKARLQFKNAIQIDPRMAEPFYQLALLDEKQQKWKGMFANLTTVEQLDPTHYDAIVKLGQIYLLAGNFELASEKANTVLDADNSNVMAWVLRATIEMKQQNLGSAMSDVEQALSIESENIEALSVKALILNFQDKPTEALALLDKALAIDPEQLSLTMIQLSILEKQKDYVAVEAIYRKLLTQRPDERWVAMALAKLLNIQNRYPDAKKVLEQYVADHEDDKEAKLLLVALVKTKNPEQAITLLESYIEQDKENYGLYFAKAKLLLDLGRSDGVIAGLEEIASLDADGNDGRRAKMMLAGYDFKQGNVESAQQKVTDVLAVAPEDEAALLLKARIELINKNVDAAVTDLRLILRNNPESDQALVLLAQAYMNTGSTELADDNFRQALIVNPGNTVAALFVANKLMKERDLDRTEEVLTKALATATNKEPLLQALAQVKILKKDWQGTQSVVDSLRVDREDTALTLYLDGQIAQGRENYKDAIEAYKAALVKSPSLMRALQGLGFSYLQLDQKPQLLQYLNAFIEKNPEQIASYGVLANMYSQDKEWDKAIATLNKGLVAEPKWQGGYSALAAVYFSQDNYENAMATYQRGIDNTTNNTLFRLQMASASEQHGDYDKAKLIYEDILAKNPDVEPAINNLASLLTDQFQSEENLQKAKELSARFSSATEPFYLDTYAWTMVLLGEYDKAQTVLERVVSLSPDVAVFNYHLGALYLKQDNKLEAEKYLNIAKSLAEQQNDTAISEKVAELLLSL
ncbi:MAG: hypothetical protein COA83_02075 [Methylophaga sp.]|nr:MAG: hypothetical protein COA83_02075 [Methylophaga sp.]